MKSGTISATGTVELHEAAEHEVSSWLIQFVSAAFNGSVTIQGAAVRSSAAVAAIAYRDTETGEISLADVTDSLIVLVPASGLEITLDATVVAGSLAYFAIPMMGGTELAPPGGGGLTDTELRAAAVSVTGVLTASEAHIGEVSGIGLRDAVAFTRPADTNNYADNDVVSSTVSDTGTTPLLGLTLARVNGVGGYITSWRVTTDNTSWTAALRVDIYTVAVPTTALTGDNVASAPKFANDGEFIASFELPSFTTPTGSDLRRASRDDLRIQFKPAAADVEVYFRYVLLAAETNEASGQTFNTVAISDGN